MKRKEIIHHLIMTFVFLAVLTVPIYYGMKEVKERRQEQERSFKECFQTFDESPEDIETNQYYNQNKEDE
jgi:hypothetical protein